MIVSVAWNPRWNFCGFNSARAERARGIKGEPDIAILRSSDEAQTVNQRIALLKQLPLRGYLARQLTPDLTQTRSTAAGKAC